MKSIINVFTGIIFLIISILACQSFSYGQSEISSIPKAKITFNQKNNVQAAKTSFRWDITDNILPKNSFSVNISDGFTCLGIGWNSSSDIEPTSIIIKYRFLTEKGWTEYYQTKGDISPKESPTKLFWTDLIFTPTQDGCKTMEFEIQSENSSVDISFIKLDAYFIEKSIEGINKNYDEIKATCPRRPLVIPRSVWLTPYYTQPAYTSTIINPTHTVIHHGASPDTYTDGAAVVRSYWNYHVNSNGWSDIGYNYLFDKYGNAYQGRQNSSPTTQDVNGAHAGASNPYSLGINFLGNADVTLPTTVQLDTVMQFLAWWYDWRGYDPTTSASMILQSSGTSSVVPRILGHKDTNIGGTSCPGTTLYADLPSIRTGTKAIIDACSGSVNPTNLVAGTPSCPDNSVTFTWQNFGTGWYIQISSSATFTSPYIKWVSGLTTYTGPAGFVLQSDGTTPLAFSNSTTYYWRIWNGTTFTNGNSFSTLNCDNISPTTLISSTNTWKTTDFTVTFTDNDNIGVEKSFYQVLDFDGTYWGANANNGFFADNFDIQQPVWTNALGTWNVNAGELIQTDEAESNSNFYSALNQNFSNRYLYHFTAKVEGTGTNRRFGFHLFCDDASQTNRGNSYFVWFRVEGQTMEFFKVIGNSFTTASNIISNVITTPGQYYDFKITYDRILGTISVWRDDIFMGSWTDTTPYSTNGNYISFRSGNSKLTVNELKVYRSRLATANVTIGDNTKDIRYQNPNASTFGAKIKSIVVDENNNLSAIAYHDLNIDWTSPSDVNIADGISSDLDTIFNSATASANWTISTDQNSGISEYWYALGSTAGGNDIIDWTNNVTNNSLTLNSLNLVYGNRYYFSVKSLNGAGLWSNAITSDGFLVLLPENINILETNNFKVFPNPFSESFNIIFDSPFSGIISLTDVTGRNIYNENIENKINLKVVKLDSFEKGLYFIQLKANNGEIKTFNLIKK